jgi:hypothetical protein
MVKNGQQPSKTVASKVSGLLKGNCYGKSSKSVTGTALSQTKSGKKKARILFDGR